MGRSNPAGCLRAEVEDLAFGFDVSWPVDNYGHFGTCDFYAGNVM